MPTRTGAGLLGFGSPDEALSGLQEVQRNYAHHCREARRLAAEHFDAGQVLSKLLESAATAGPETT